MLMLMLTVVTEHRQAIPTGIEPIVETRARAWRELDDAVVWESLVSFSFFPVGETPEMLLLLMLMMMMKRSTRRRQNTGCCCCCD